MWPTSYNAHTQYFTRTMFQFQFVIAFYNILLKENQIHVHLDHILINKKLNARGIKKTVKQITAKLISTAGFTLLIC